VCFWAVIADLRVEKSGTRISWKSARPLPGHRASDLIEVSDGDPLPGRILRIDAVVETPSSLQRESGRLLEAAHIDSHSASGDNRTDNGLLLRADLHTLFDMNLLRIDPETLRIDLAKSLRSSAYGDLHDQPLRPRTDGGSPSKPALRARWRAPVERAGDA